MYLGFPIYPYAPKNIARALSKQPKFYFFDNADVDSDIGARFENLVACNLLKRLQFLSDSEGERNELRYIRDKDKREVDFVIIRAGKIDELIEVKYADTQISDSLRHYTKILQPRTAIQIVAKLDRSYSKDGIRNMSVFDYFSKKIW
jgi:predicted AAA+ superfamily ATPase